MRALAVVLALGGWLAAQDATHLEAGDCALCHTRIRAPQVGQHPLWKNSMMSRAGRDPYWQARVQRERELLPAAHALIDEKCFRCHTPTAADLGQEVAAREGVTCTVCHRVTEEAFGTVASFTGGFRLSGKKEIYGPHARPFQMPMLMHTTMAPVESAHVLRPELCATCHTVITPVLDAAGKAQGDFYEQAPYLEWLASNGGETGQTCQQCHMPELREAEYIAHRPPGGPFPPTRARQPFAQHEFTGGNAQMLRRMGGDPARTVAQLASALLLEASLRREGDHFRLGVRVQNQTGHKLPTGFPGRRLWLRVTAWDAAGAPVFLSGGTGADFRQPHRQLISTAREVMVWEARLKGESLLLDAAWEKDNRILPAGYDESRLQGRGVRPEALRPVGVREDADFVPGADRVAYRLPDTTARVLVEACFLSAPEMGEEEPAVLARLEVKPAAAAAFNVRPGSAPRSRR
jgi:hypothetical protein